LSSPTRRRAKKAMTKIVKLHEAIENSKQQLNGLTQNIADCASAMLCNGDEINDLETK
jgi:hypothetical protein